MAEQTKHEPQRDQRDQSDLAHVEQNQKDHDLGNPSKIARLDPEVIEKGVPADPDPDDPVSP